MREPAASFVDQALPLTRAEPSTLSICTIIRIVRVAAPQAVTRPVVDSHQHFWDPARADYPWMTDDVAALRRRFGPDDLEPLLRENGVAGTVVVQARQSLDETRELLALAD